ncbi:MAG: ParB/RepB/Spo0J family partition protein, partial [Oscillospiraceae bacterium]|nr:ParB/RepB/Spo0J family partition protein [Oscillospiraceae bacterium]
MAKNSAAGLLTSVDSMFTTQEERDNVQRSYLTDIPATEISDFPNHPFHVRMDEEMERLVDSVKERGVLSPVLVRPMPDGGYQMVSGHRRKRAAELAELPMLSCIVRELTDDEATIILVDSNLQREQILPSEKAFAYKMKLDALKRQGKRVDLTSSPLDKKLKGTTSAQQISKDCGDSQPQIYRYIRLTNLLPELLEMVDNSVLKESGVLQMALRPAVEL